MGPYNGAPNPTHDLAFLATCCHKGDLDSLQTLLESTDVEQKFAGDINTHVTDMTPLMYAAQAGQVEAVEVMLKARADPHMKCRMPQGKDPSDGETACEIAAKCGWDDIVEVLKQAEKTIPPHKYKRYGKDNNCRLTIYDTGETGVGKDALAAMKRTDYVPGQAKKPAAKALPPSTVAFLFPGQGSQYVKMMEGLKDEPDVKPMIETARRVLGYDLLDVCLNGPEDKLGETSVCQPAVFLGGMAGLTKLKREKPSLRPGCLAGLSLGEYTALCAAGVFTFEEGMELVKVRGEAMAEAAASRPQAMLSVAGLDQETLEKLCAEQAVAGEVCQVANVLFPNGFACSGTTKAIEGLKTAAEGAGAMQAKLLKTSGAFHTSLMEPARERLEAALTKLLPRMKPPSCDIFLNVTGQRIKAGTPPSEIVPLLGRQLVSPVLWEPSVRAMIKDGFDEYYEIGPMKQLRAMMKRIDTEMWNATTNVEV